MEQMLCCANVLIVWKGVNAASSSGLAVPCSKCCIVLVLPVGIVKGSSRLERVAVSYGSEDRRGVRG
jgi:hypothetical protein